MSPPSDPDRLAEPSALSAAASAGEAWVPPSQVDEYQLIRLIGRGGAGLVFLADDTLLERPVSVKFLRALDPESLSRFVIEARAAARVQHPNVATLYRVGQLENRPYLVSEFVRGRSLDRLERPLDWRTAVGLAKDVAAGLAAAHRCGVLHRDIKPANAVLTHDGQVKLLDFGLAKLVGPASTSGEREAAGLRRAGVAPSAPQVTDPNGLVGTPYYMAPECWRGEESTTRSDLFSLGALLYELCSGAPPHHTTSFFDLPDVVSTQRVPPLRERAPDVPPGLAAIVDRCLELEPLRRFASAEEVLSALEELTLAEKRGAAPEGNPYRGLQPFYAEHRHLFFGRSRDVSAVIERLRTHPFVVLTGDSGVGKSSLCFAGVLPAVAEGALRDGRTWLTARWVPGRSPVSALCASLAAAIGCDEAALEAIVRDQPEALGRELRGRLGRDRGLLLYVDQLEELITLSSPEGAAAIGEVLGPIAAGMPGLALLATARSDFLTRLASVPRLGEHLPRALLLLRLLNVQELREAVTGPVRAAGGRFESEALIDTLVRAASQTSGGLPLVQFALAELWSARNPTTGVISASSLDAIGGVGGALARHAEAVLASLLPDQRRAARELLVRLVTPQGTRARRTDADLAGSVPVRRAALDALVDGRLLVAHELEGTTVYELAHEALLTGSTTIAGWIGEEAETRGLRERLASAAAEWERLGQSSELLWTHRQLSEAAVLPREALTQREQQFLRESRRRLQRRWAWTASTIAAGVLLLVAVYALLSEQLQQERRRELAVELERANTGLAQARATESKMAQLRQDAFARFDHGDRAGGERLWKEVLEGEREASQAYLEADDHHERAIVLGSGAPELRNGYAKLLLERAEVAERAHRSDLAAMFLQRMRLHDVGGDGARAWASPATVQVNTVPAGARIDVEVYTRGDGRWTAKPFEAGGSAPQRLSLPPGSYVLTARHPGRLPVRYPLSVGRGEATEVSLRLPLPTQVPPGFAFIPAGQFLFGSGDDETIREFFNAVPLHPVRTGPYLIARTETTFADWIAYLDALPLRERARRTPRSSSTGLHGHLALTRGRAGWRLELNPAGKTYAAKEGEPLRFLGRMRRSEQNWLHFPVSGISFDDARAYAAWLAKTGRVPGARLCTELEWERAARGADERTFPHGNRLEPEDANFDQTYGKDPLAFGPDEVGQHAASRSPFDVDDLTGNVWEWVESSLQPGQAVARGGSFYFAATTCRATNRETPERSLRDLAVGLRICASPSF